MQIAMFYANWEKFGEPWSTPLGFRWELESRGHDVRVYNLYHSDGDFLPRKTVRSYSGEAWNKFNFDFKNRGYKPDAVLVMDYGVYDYAGMNKQYFPDIPFILEAGDTPQSTRMHAQKVSKFHGVFTPDWESSQIFTQMGVKSLWATHWADTRVFHGGYDVKPEFDVVSTCGGRKVTAQIQAALGSRFNNERYFFGEEHAKRLMMGHIVFQCSQFGEITRRPFEGMACGRMVLTDRLPECTRMHELFVDGEDIVYYNSAEDAIDKINYYTSHPEERERIARNGAAKIAAAHTIGHRVNELEDLIRSIQHDFIGATS